MKTIELFGKVYEEIEDDSSECACALCALFERCKKTVESDLPCERTDGSVNRHFVLVNDEKN